VVGVLLVVLIATGIALTFRYRPDVSVFSSVTSLEHRPILTLRRVHRVSSQLFVLAVGCLAIASIGLFIARRRRIPIVFSILAGVLAITASISGYLLPWDQLSLWAVTVGSNMRGYTSILRGHSVKYVLLGSTEVGTPTVQRWFWVHSIVVPLLVVGVLTALLIAARRQKASGSVL
jgi:quinol-cytochrome oxidoreductase complex cytochrome b subunit